MRSREEPEVPELPVLISLIGTLDFNNLTLYADAGKAYDWHLVAALEVEIFASASTPFRKLLATLAGIAAGVPKHMVLAFEDGPRIDCGDMRTVTDFAVFDWFPMVVMPIGLSPANHIKAWNDGKAIEKKLWHELGRALPIPYDKAMELVVKIAGENRA